MIASRKFATENRWLSWWHLVSTVALLAALIAIVGYYPNLLMRSACSLLIALTLVRMFILYHDYMHHAIFRNSRLAGWILKFYGHLMLTPPSVWKQTHDHHHQHNSKLFGADIGSFPIMTTETYQAASRGERFAYRFARSPLVILCGYLVVFLYGMCIYPLIKDFKHNLGVFWTLVLHFGTVALGLYFCGAWFTCFAFIFPTWLAMLLGSYLFYIQHNFPDAKIHGAHDWSYGVAALLSSSHLETGAVMQWFLGNIGFHHVHHLNAKIPFYRLPEAMAGLPDLQSPGKTTFALKDVVSCLRLKLWDTEQNRFVSFSP